MSSQAVPQPVVAEPRNGWAKKLLSRLLAAVPAVIFGIIILLVWQFGVKILHIASYEVATPTTIFRTYETSWHQIWFNFERTLSEAVIGMIIGTAVGFTLGVLLGYSRLLEKAMVPYIVAATTIPIVAVVPILLLWLGEGANSKIAVTAFIVFFPLCINTLKGIRSTPRSAMELFRVQAASRPHEFWKLRAPASLPYVFVGLKLSAAGAAIGAIVAEFVGSSRGLGYLMLQSSYVLNTAMLWSAMVAAAVLGMTLFIGVVILEKIFLSWHESA
jgi:NitT/TauT family transport system permease protein